MNTVYKTKSQVRTETANSVEAFLAAGGTIQVIKARKAPKQKMSGKTTRSTTRNGSLGFRTNSFGG